MHRPCPAAVLCLLTLVPIATLAAPTEVTDLGLGRMAMSISDDGEVVVGAFLVGPSPERGLFRWTRGGGVEAIGGAMDIAVADISADGQTIAGTVRTDRLEAAFWKEGSGWTTLTDTGLLHAPAGWATTTLAISANGQRIAGTTKPPPIEMDLFRPFTFNPDVEDAGDFGWQELPRWHKAGRTEATDISNDGRTQVGKGSSRGPFAAMRWRDGLIEPLLDARRKPLGGEMVRCNSDCSVITGGGGGSSAVTPVLSWRLLAQSNQPACYFKPLTLPAQSQFVRYHAYRTSENGNVVVGTYYYTDFAQNPPDFVRKGFIWIGDARGGTMHDLQVYLSQLGETSLSAWQGLAPTGISADGRYLVGSGDDPQGRVRSWRVDLGIVPEGSASDPGYTLCPTNRHYFPPTRPLDKGTESAPAVAWLQPSGDFQGADGRRYFVRARGDVLLGGTRKDKLAALTSLGGDHYYDPKDGIRRVFQRNRAGIPLGMREKRGKQFGPLWRRSH